MEQKTEASQAVDELLPCPLCASQPTLLIRAIACDCCLCELGRSKGQSDADLAMEWNQRAALKAQPAPTEAPKGSQIGWVNTKYDIFIPLSGLASTKRNSELLASRELIAVYGAGQLSGNSGELQTSGNTGELAQGEDSARLDAERYRWLCEKFGVTWLPCFLEDKLERGYIEDGKVSIDAVIDRARASAETGGVKS